MTTERMQFGLPRTTCACQICKTNCEFMPGFLIPADLERMMPTDVDPMLWAEENLLASPGALVANSATGKTFRIGTLVPKTKPDGSCIHLNAEGLCQIHPVAPFGCSFFDCGPERNGISRDGLMAVLDAHRDNGLYAVIWRWLHARGDRQLAPEVLRERMAAKEKAGATTM